MDLKFKIKKSISENSLCTAGDRLLFCVSGGVDSMVMLDIFRTLADDLGIIPIVAHVNHGLRGADSDGDEKHVESYCSAHGIPFYVKMWNGPLKGESLQDSARNFRYACFSEIAADAGAETICLAHNLNDQAETLLINLVRGSGPEGLRGMRLSGELGEFRMIRPLLQITRKEIAEYATANNITFRNDASNDETKYRRNFLRHKVMPLLTELNAKAAESIAATAELIELDEAYLDGVVDAKFATVATYGCHPNSSICHPNSSKCHPREGGDPVTTKLDSRLRGNDRKGNGNDRNEIGNDRANRNDNTIDNIVLDISALDQLSAPIRIRILRKAYRLINGSIAGINRDQLTKIDGIITGKKADASYDLANGIKAERKSSKLVIFKE